LTIALVTMVFFAALGLLAVSYTLHFRRRALAMGPERLLAALSRTVAGEGEAADADLRRGASELESRLKRAFYAVSAILTLVLIACLALTAASTMPELAFALSGLCIFLVSLAVSIMMLREIPRNIGRHLDSMKPEA
jgi:hypothetical protein